MLTDRVLEIFKDITRVPRESGHEEQIVAFLCDFAKQHSLDYRVDAAGNVVITKPASPGKENVPTLVLQSHSDMVCEARDGVEHDFSKDPIHYEIRDGWMVAPDTTLGADCGIGIAASLAIAESDLPTGKIECLVTVSEETGLDGAKALKPGFITGHTLINLDSEDEGELFVGCAGGLDTLAEFNVGTCPVPDNATLVSLKICNCAGGHSGDDIDKSRANAVQLLSRFLYTQLGKYSLCAIDGGNKVNAIAHTASCVLAVRACDAEDIEDAFRKFGEDIKVEYSVTEPNIEFRIERVSGQYEAFDDFEVQRIVCALNAAPHGVLAMSQDIPGLVETSTNLASVKVTGKGRILVGTSQRSSITSARRAAAEKVRACFELAGAEVSHVSEYPGWKPNLNSSILEISRKAYVELFGVEPVVRAIHAGLECGLFLDIYPDLDMISFGPTLRCVHAPGEKLDLNSLEKFVKHLDKVVTEWEG
ncbi:MAG: aminoacyl-histidine dipeptidase [Bacteroidales bacterium]|nr:aminoacyl-histidine dipeptidase [Bacteroidales bacterium]